MSAATSEATTNEKANCDIQDDKLYYTSLDTFMFAIQDQGREKTAKSHKGKNEAGVMTFPKVKKGLSRHLQENTLQAQRPTPFT